MGLTLETQRLILRARGPVGRWVIAAIRGLPPQWQGKVAAMFLRLGLLRANSEP